MIGRLINLDIDLVPRTLSIFETLFFRGNPEFSGKHISDTDNNGRDDITAEPISCRISSYFIGTRRDGRGLSERRRTDNPRPVLLGEEFYLDGSFETCVLHPLAELSIIYHSVTRHAPIKAYIFSITQPIGGMKVQKPWPSALQRIKNIKRVR